MELTNLIKKVADSVCSRVNGELISYAQSDIDQDIRYLAAMSIQAEETRPEPILLLIHQCGSWCGPLSIALEDKTILHAAFTYDHYLQKGNRAFLIELDGQKHPERWGHGDLAYGSIREIPVGIVLDTVERHTYTFHDYNVEYKAKRGYGIVKSQFPAFVAESSSKFEREYGEIISIDGVETPEIAMKKAAVLDTLRRAASKKTVA